MMIRIKHDFLCKAAVCRSICAEKSKWQPESNILAEFYFDFRFRFFSSAIKPAPCASVNVKPER